MDTDLLDFGSADSPADSGELYGDVSALSRSVTVPPSSTGTVVTAGQPSAMVDSVESTPAPPPPSSQLVNPPQSATWAGKPDTHALTGKPDPHTLTGKPDSHTLAGKPDPHTLTGKPDAHALAGKPDPHTLTSKPDPHTLTGKPDPPPAAHGLPAPSPHYKSPTSANDGVPAVKPRHDVPSQKTSTVPAIPPRKPRNPAVYPAVPARPEASLPKATQPQPPLPRITPVSRKSALDSVSNRTYGVSARENARRCTAEGNGNTPPVPVPRNVAAGHSETARLPASTDATPPVSSDSPAPCDTVSAGEQVSKLSDLQVSFAFTKFVVCVLWKI